jgi:cytosine/adenosine deaminase-related metal-dependent hydrolase
MESTVINNCIIVTMDTDRRVIEDGGLVIRDDRILDLGTSREITAQYDGDRVIDGEDKLVLPGLIDGHGHAGHSLLKSLGLHNENWYKACEVIYSRASTEAFWEVDALLTNLERLRFGTTCGVTFFGGGDSVMRMDDPLYAERHCSGVKKVGVRTLLAVGPRRPPYPRRYSSWNGLARSDKMVDFDDMLENTRTIIDGCHGSGDGRINIAIMFPTPHPERKPIQGVELEDLKDRAGRFHRLSESNGLLFTMDGHSRGTIKFSHEELGLTGPDSLFSHSTDLTAEEIRICAETETKIVHNPSAVASMLGRCPVTELIDAGVTVMMGSDAAAPDRSYDMFRHMFQSMRYHRRYYRDPRVLPPGKTLEMCTIDGARALGLEDEIGSIERGKKADITILDLRKPHLYPINMPVDRVVYFANGNDVDTVIVDGKILLEGGRFKGLDVDRVLDQAQMEIKSAVELSSLDNLFEIPEDYWGSSRY